jgi:hypothetical protein
MADVPSGPSLDSTPHYANKKNHLPLHRATTTAVQMAAPVPEIMDTSKTLCGQNAEFWYVKAGGV